MDSKEAAEEIIDQFDVEISDDEAMESIADPSSKRCHRGLTTKTAL